MPSEYVSPLTPAEGETVKCLHSAVNDLLEGLCKGLSPEQQHLFLASVALDIDFELANLRREYPGVGPHERQ